MRRLGLVGVLGISFMLGGCETIKRGFAWYMAKEAWEECSQERPRYCVASAIYATYALSPNKDSKDIPISNRNEESP